jgi:hypothetical protein
MSRSPKPLSPEFALLAACGLLDDEQLATAAPLAQGAAFDWDRFVALGSFHGVEQVARARLDRLLPGTIPEPHRAKMQRQLVQAAALNAAHARAAVSTVDLLEQAGIPALVLKGAALAGQLYAADRDLRCSSDVDILVAPEQFDSADSVLGRAGFARSWPEEDPPAAARAMFLRLANVFDYRGPAHEEMIELHCRATLNPHALPASFAELAAASVEVQTGHGAVRTLGGPLQVQYLCQHFLTQLPHRLKWFGDIARALRLSGKASCADYVASYPRLLPLAPARLADTLLRDFAKAIAGDSAVGPEFVRIAAAMERAEGITVARSWARVPLELRHLLFVLRLTEGWRGKATEIVLALADPRDAVSLRLSPRFAPVYALAGPLLALRRFARRGKPLAS